MYDPKAWISDLLKFPWFSQAYINDGFIHVFPYIFLHFSCVIDVKQKTEFLDFFVYKKLPGLSLIAMLEN